MRTIALLIACLLTVSAQAETVIDNDNFIVKAPSPELARAVMARAETMRDRLSLKWLGAQLPPSVGPTVIDFKLDEDQDRGKAWTAIDAERLSHMVWLNTSVQRALGSTLAHEMTHVVLATEYPGQIPPWLDEGAASLEDDPKRKATRESVLAWFARTGNWPSLRRTLEAKFIAPHDQRAYAVACSVSEFLLTLGDEPKLVRFGVEADRVGYDLALRHHYNFSGVDELQSRWQAWVMGGGR